LRSERNMMLALACASLLALTGALATEVFTSPLLLWSNQDGVVGRGSGAQVMYNVLSDAEGATTNAVLGLLGQGGYSTDLVNLQTAAHKGLSVVIFAGSQLSSSDLRQGKAVRLSDVLDSSASSLVLPFAESQSHNSASSLLKSLEDAGLTVKTVGCGHQAALDLTTEISSALASSGPSVVLVCPSVDRALSNTQAGLEQELEQLLMVQEVVDAAEVKHVSVYLSLGTTQGGLHRRRALQQAAPTPSPSRVVKEPLKGFGPYTTCGTLCQTQVRWLEALLAVLFMALAICSGLTCLNVLNTPTRFELPTDS